MLAYFFVTLLGIITIGPLSNEGGGNAIRDKGTKVAASAAWEQREALDYSKLND